MIYPEDILEYTPVSFQGFAWDPFCSPIFKSVGNCSKEKDSAFIFIQFIENVIF
jgi:hypothetical protein